MTRVVNVARDFSPLPMGRSATHSPFSGERFRDELLVPALNIGDTVVDLTGTRGRSASFLDEAFARLLDCGFSLRSLEMNLEVHAEDDPQVAEFVWRLIRDRAHRISDQGSGT